jgi:hypothetical protein
MLSLLHCVCVCCIVFVMCVPATLFDDEPALPSWVLDVGAGARTCEDVCNHRNSSYRIRMLCMLGSALPDCPAYAACTARNTAAFCLERALCMHNLRSGALHATCRGRT